MTSFGFREWIIWRTLKLGTGLKTADDFRRALKKLKCKIGDWADYILGRPSFKANETEVELDLVIVSNIDLGLEKGAKLPETYARAKECGLELCPDEAGPQLRLQYLDQPKGECLLIAMELVVGPHGSIHIFQIECYGEGDGECWLNGLYGHVDNIYDGARRFILVLPKKK